MLMIVDREILAVAPPLSSAEAIQRNAIGAARRLFANWGETLKETGMCDMG